MISTTNGWKWNVEELARMLESSASEEGIIIEEDTDSGLIGGTLREVLIDIYTKLGAE